MNKTEKKLTIKYRRYKLDRHIKRNQQIFIAPVFFVVVGNVSITFHYQVFHIHLYIQPNYKKVSIQPNRDFIFVR